MAENIVSKIKSYRRKRLTLGFVNRNSITDAERKLLSMGSDAIDANLYFEINYRNYNEWGTSSDHLDVNNARGDCSNNPFSAVQNARVEVDITNKHDHTADLEI